MKVNHTTKQWKIDTSEDYHLNRSGRLAERGKARRLPDRNGLWAWRRRAERSSGEKYF